MVRWIVAVGCMALLGALSVSSSEAAKAKKKTEKVEYLRAAGSEPPASAVKPTKKSRSKSAR